nr:hypothetical protein GCM10020063_025830 [Dactylosporangium thailandense]
MSVLAGVAAALMTRRTVAAKVVVGVTAAVALILGRGGRAVPDDLRAGLAPRRHDVVPGLRRLTGIASDA